MNDRSIAYFSMEIALDPAMPTYAGGLGILARDTIRSAADLEVPFVAVTLLHRKGSLKPAADIVYLENYDIEKLLTAGVDLWLNTPQPPLEASGTSGMKAALNGVPTLSVLGWWIEGCIEGETGWAIGTPESGAASLATVSASDVADAASLYDKLERAILPLYHHNRDGYIDVMRHSISLNGSFFDTHRMIQQYVLKAYLC